MRSRADRTVLALALLIALGSASRTLRSAPSAESASRPFESAKSAKSASRSFEPGQSAPSPSALRAPAFAEATAGQSAAKSASPGREEITRALAAVKADPNLAAERTITTLRWNEGPRRAARPTPAWITWIAGLFGWLEQSARVLVWTAAAALVGILVVYLLRIARAARAARDAEPFVAPTHVRDLDIRPETLPDDIGRAARALWDRGDHRAALALLYRGLLSRLAHVHRLPIRDSTTEGDCLALAATHLPQSRREYAAELVRVWQRAVYGGEPAPSPAVYALCDGFAAALDSSPAGVAIGGGAL